MRFNPFRRRPAQPLRNNTLGQPMAGFSLPARAELEPLPEELPAELESSGLTPDQLIALMTLVQGVSPADTDTSTPAPGGVRKAVLSMRRPAPDAAASALTPEEEALTSRQGRLNAMGGAIPSRPTAGGRNLEQGLLAAELANPAVQQRMRGAQGTIEGLAGGAAMTSLLPLLFGSAALGGTAAGLGRVLPTTFEQIPGPAGGFGALEAARRLSQNANILDQLKDRVAPLLSGIQSGQLPPQLVAQYRSLAQKLAETQGTRGSLVSEYIGRRTNNEALQRSIPQLIDRMRSFR